METRRLQFTVTLNEDAIPVLVDLFAEALKRIQPQPPKLSPADEKRAARSQQCRNASFAGEEPPTDRGLLVNSREAARLLNVSDRTIFEMEKTGRMPKAIRIGQAVRFSYEELKAWVAAGGPAIDKASLLK